DYLTEDWRFSRQVTQHMPYVCDCVVSTIPYKLHPSDIIALRQIAS
ncbi:10791_t:CDS:1, partial [Funneliformis mosseae]